MGEHTDWLAHSDHSPMAVDLQINPHRSNVPRPRHETRTPDEPDSTEQEISLIGSHHHRFDLAPGDVDDMICGNNGQNLTQVFRPSYFTADWVDGTLVEVKVWGPRVLKGGSLGRRPLDHYWSSTPANGPIRLGDLPPAVADRIRAYSVERGLPNRSR